MDLIEILRLTNVVLALGGLLWLGIRSLRRWPEYPPAVRLFILTLSFYAFAAAEGSFEAVLLDSPVGARSFVFLVANVALLVTLALTNQRRDIGVDREGRR